MAATLDTSRRGRSPVHVLLVDASGASRSEVSALLRRCGPTYTVSLAPDSKQALSILQAPEAAVGEVDVVLADVNHTKGVLGILTCINETERLKGTPVVVMSEAERLADKTVLDCLEAGACDFLLKPACPQKLGNLWQHAWRKSHPSQPGFQWQVQDRRLTNSSAASSGTKAMGDDMAGQRSGTTSATPSVEVKRLQKGAHSGDRYASDAHSDTSNTEQCLQSSGRARDPSGSEDEQPPKHQSETPVMRDEPEAEGAGSGEGEDDADQLPGSVRALPRGLLELAKVGNLREKEREQIAALPGPKPWAMKLKHSTSCSAFTLFREQQAPEEPKTEQQERQLQQLPPASLPQMPFALDPALAAAMAAVSQANLSGHGAPFGLPSWAAMLPGGALLPVGIPGLIPQPHLLGGSFGHALQEAIAQAASQQQPEPAAPAAAPLPAADVGAAVGGSHARRAAALAKFREKRKSRNFDKKVRYQSRKRLAEERPRIRGQFVKRPGPDGAAPECAEPTTLDAREE